MVLIIVGLFIIIIGYFMTKQNQPSSLKVGKLLLLAGPGILIFGILSACFKIIEAGEVGVKSLFGKVDNEVLHSGLNFVNPLVEITYFDVKTQNYTMSAVHEEGSKVGDDAIRILSSDGLEVIIDLSVLFRVKEDKAPYILKDIGVDYVDKIVRPISRTAIRDNAVYYEAVALYSTRRDEFQNRIYKYIEKSFASRGLQLEQLLIRNISLPASVRKTIESKINAEQEAQKMIFVLQKEKQEAERKRVEAQGIADYQRILSSGLSDKQLQYEMIKAQKEIATSPNAKVIILGNQKGTPIIIGN